MPTDLYNLNSGYGSADSLKRCANVLMLNPKAYLSALVQIFCVDLTSNITVLSSIECGFEVCLSHVSRGSI